MSKSTSPKRRHQPPVHNPKEICMSSGRKITYRSRKVALTALNQILAPRQRATKFSQPNGVYRCEHCRGWHLTSHARYQG